MNNLKCAAIIVAAGKGKRMGSNVLKQYLSIDGIPILARTLLCFQNSKSIDNIVVVTGKNEIDFCKKEIIENFNITKASYVIEGGGKRQESVFKGLSVLDKNTDIVLIHDGVRPFIKEKYIDKIITDTSKFGSCVLGVQVKDTIKICDNENIVESTPKREYLWAAQTPQAFQYNLIMKAHKKALEDNFIGTDDSMLVERIGYKVKITEGDYDNIKITTSEDLIFGEAIIKK